MTVSKYIFLNTSLKLYLVYAYIFKNLVCVYVCVYIIYVMYIMHVIYIYYIYYSYIVIVHLAYDSIFFFQIWIARELRRAETIRNKVHVRCCKGPASASRYSHEIYKKQWKPCFFMMLLLSILPYKDKNGCFT